MAPSPRNRKRLPNKQPEVVDAQHDEESAAAEAGVGSTMGQMVMGMVPKRLRRGAKAEGDDGGGEVEAQAVESLPPKKPPAAKRAGSVKSPPVPPAVASSPVAASFNHYLYRFLLIKANDDKPKNTNPDEHRFMQWVKQQYQAYLEDPTQSQLTADQVKVLEHVHFPLTSRGDEHWNRCYELLRQYHEQHGHSQVPRLCMIPALGDWVSDQRRQYRLVKTGKASQMTPEREAKLEELGFVWRVRNRADWDLRFQELVDYKSQNGHCQVPQNYKANKSLGKWVAKQREQYKFLQEGKHSFLTQDRLQLLNDIGFVWRARKATETTDLGIAADGGVKTGGVAVGLPSAPAGAMPVVAAMAGMPANNIVMASVASPVQPEGGAAAGMAHI